ncbi:MAG: DNA alkylation repair protein [Prevotella sp.]|nr:DNA alkylation repair protein [Prevotella sp.]MBQ9203329.1 DNA alkylation repair protein [Prevotella sp.]
MTDIQQQVKDIKQSFRQMMDGAIAKSMRDKGADYKLNWGATIPRLRQMADEIRSASTLHETTLYSLSIALWKEDVRECKILATMLMPADEMLPEVVDIWMEQIPSQEVAEQVSFNVWQHLPYAPEKAYQWLASDREYDQLCGFLVLTRLFMNGQEPNERGINEYIDQMLAAIQGPYPSVRKAAMLSVQRFAELGLVYERMAKSAMKSVNLDIF